jgi:hypothetical protein
MRWFQDAALGLFRKIVNPNGKNWIPVSNLLYPFRNKDDPYDAISPSDIFTIGDECSGNGGFASSGE